MNRACPKCRARRGRPCRTASGNPASKPHAARGAKVNARSKRKPAKKKVTRRRNPDELIVLADLEGFELTPGIRKQWARFEEEVDRALQKHLNEEEYDEVLREAEHQYIPVYQTLSNQGRGVWDKWDHLSFDADKLNRKLLSDRRLVDLVDITGGGTLAEEIEMPDLDDLAEIAGRDSAVEGVRVIDREEPTIQLDLGDSFVHLSQYDDGTWWWQRRGFPLQTVEDEDVEGYPFAKALRNSLSEDNPRTKNKAPRKKPSKLKKRVKKAGHKVKKFAKTKTGYGAAGAGAGALLLGPLGAIAGAVGASSLHDNPGGDLGDIFEVQVEFFSDKKLKETFKEVSEGLSESKDPIRDFGTEGYPMYKRMLASLTKGMVSRGFLELNPRGKKKKAAKKKSRKARSTSKRNALKRNGTVTPGQRERDIKVVVFEIAGSYRHPVDEEYIYGDIHWPVEVSRVGGKVVEGKEMKAAFNAMVKDGLMEKVRAAPGGGRKTAMWQMTQLGKDRWEGMYRNPKSNARKRVANPVVLEPVQSGSFKYKVVDTRTGKETKHRSYEAAVKKRDALNRKLERVIKRHGYPVGNPSAADHERAGRDALANSEEFHKRYERYGRVNDLLDTYQWLVIAHEELKYSDKSEPRIQARDGLEEIRRQLERIIK